MKRATCGFAVASVAIGLAISSFSVGEDRSPAQDPPPSKVEAAPQALEYLIGHWQVEATDPKSGKTEKISYSVQRFVGSAWLSGAARSEEPGFEAKDVWGYDPITNEVVRVVFDGSGTYAIVRSPGWANGTLVLEGDARSTSGIVRVRETIRQVSRDEFHATWEAHRDGVWSAYSIERAKRIRAR